MDRLVTEITFGLNDAATGRKAACAILGHKTVRTFDETYAHVLRELGYGKRLIDAVAGLEPA